MMNSRKILNLRSRWNEVDSSYWKLRVAILQGNFYLFRPTYFCGLIDLRGINLNFCLNGIHNLSLRDNNFDDCDLSWSILSCIDLSNTSFCNSKLLYADLSNSNLSGSDFHRADLTHANLRNSKINRAFMKESNLTRANCKSANFYGTNLLKTNFASSDLQDAIFEECILHGVNIKDCMLNNANGFIRLLPAGIGRWSVGRFIFESFLTAGKTRLRDEEEGDYEGAADIYAQLKELVKKAGDRESSGELFYRWRRCRRVTLPTKLERLWDFTKCVVIGYGESMIRPLFVGLSVVIIFGLIYWKAVSLEVNAYPESKNPTFLDCLAASAASFVTLGRSDVVESLSTVCTANHYFSQIVWKWLPSIEGLIGGICISLFATVAFRKIVRE